MEDTYVRLINGCFYLFLDLEFPPLGPNIFFWFSNHQGAVFFFFLLLSLPSSVLQWHHEGGNIFSEYDQSNCLFYVGYYLEVSSSLNTFNNLFISYFLWPFYLFHSPPVSKFSKYFFSNFLSVQVSEPYKAMLQT